MTQYNPVFRSPIAVSEPAQPVTRLGLSDLTGVLVTLIKGDAADLLQKEVSTVPAKPGDLVNVDGGLLARLSPHEFYLFGLSAQANLPTAAELGAVFTQAGSFAHATDLTHGRAALKLTGPAAAEALSKICGLDFHDSQFADMTVKQTSAAKIKTLIARRDEAGRPTYHLHVNRPMGQYFWEIVWDAGQEFGVVVG